MKRYRVMAFCLLGSLLSCFVFCFYLSRQETALVAEAGEENFPAPFDLVDRFYQAVEKNNWTQVKSLVTSSWWAEMHRSGYQQKWQGRVQNDPSIDFVMFLAVSQKIDFSRNSAWMMGKADWVSARQKLDDEHVTVFFLREPDGWKIDAIRANLPVEAVAGFYRSIAQGQFNRLSSYLTEEYWELLSKGEIIDSLRADWQKNRTGVYCIFYLKDFGLDQNTAWVKGDVSWNPLTWEEKETPATVFLTGVNDGAWKIRKITGHWEAKK